MPESRSGDSPATLLPWTDWQPARLQALETATQQMGRELFASLPQTRTYFWQKSWWEEKLLSWSMSQEALKVELFRFVDVLPMLRSPAAILNHLVQYLKRSPEHVPSWMFASLALAQAVPGVRHVAASLVRFGAGDFAKKFIAGANAAEVLKRAESERVQGRLFTLDILGEAVITEREAEQHAADYCRLIETISLPAAAWKTEPGLDNTAYGPLPRVNVSIKLSALDAKFDAIDPQGTLQRAGARLREILRVAQRHGAFINVDMESYEKKDLTLALVKQILMEPEFRDLANVGIVIQCYLREAGHDLLALRDWAKQRSTPIWVRLVKGAYWDYETILALSRGWPVPVFRRKPESDRNYEQLTRFLLQNTDCLRPAFASHNIRSLAHVIAAAADCELTTAHYEMQMLYGMADPEKSAMVSRGERLRIYMPFGELIPGMAYLVRRLLENTSNDSFIRAGFLEHASLEKLLRSPNELLNSAATAKSATEPITVPTTANEPSRSTSHASTQTMSATATTASANIATRAVFENHPPVDFSRAESREKMTTALRQVREAWGRHFPLVIGGERIDTAEKITSVNPTCFSQVVATSAHGEKQHIDQAVAAAKHALSGWWKLGANGRANCLRRAAEHLSHRLFELAAWEVYECGKTWREATADVDEAIDFLRYYSDQAVHLQAPHDADVPGEQNRFEYMPRGVVGVIAPWNFPLAIITGMSAAALAAGNTVVLKPAETAIAMGGWLQEILEQAGVPAGVVNFVPGEGAVVGAALVEHRDVAMIVFTGSREVGLKINAQAAIASQQAPQVKRVVAEMGGKNAIIIDDSADLDEAVLGVAKSAFGFQGQKCSACSRVIVLPTVYESFLTRLVETVKTLQVGPPEHPGTDIGPVIDASAWEKITAYHAVGRSEGREMLAVEPIELAKQGYFTGPHIYADIPPHSRLAQEEIFGPVLAVIRAPDFKEALRIANDTPFALTGGLYSRTPEHIERAKHEFQVGNLYLNRTITGALVGRHPFGGFKMSGIGSKAGGPDYLLQFVLPRVITENTLRRGFAPSED
jgi:RHH-type transcriptional regulator, proline utilization regulon repressor / proline dehydrogenase / delta 1-pyrroline-5-carboxylate dehydrogenase